VISFTIFQLSVPYTLLDIGFAKTRKSIRDPHASRA
jgi:hypothetical protein